MTSRMNLRKSILGAAVTLAAVFTAWGPALVQVAPENVRQIIIRNSSDPDNYPRITTTSPLPNGTEDVSYSTTIQTAAGVGKQPFTFSIVSGSLPGGLSLNTSSGAITGTPPNAGSSTFTIRVVDALGGHHAVAFSLTIDAASGYPDANNTGWEHTGVTLTTYSSPCTINVAGTVIDSKNITCNNLIIRANNVTVKRSKLTMTGSGGAICNDCDAGGSFTGLLVEDVEINCSLIPGTTAITAEGYTARRVNAYGCENTAWCNGNCTIIDSYLHDNLRHDTQGCPIEEGSPNCHTDGVQIPSGGSNVTIQHSRIYGGYTNGSVFGNAAITMGGSTSNIIVNNNILAGGGYTLYCNQKLHGAAAPTNQYTDNRFSTVFVSTVGGFGPIFDMDDCTDGTFTGNVCHETGLALSTCD